MTARLTAIVPIKQLAHAKSRLAAVLSPEQRRELMLWMASRVLDALHDARVAEAVYVVTPDPEAARLATSRRAIVVADPGLGLNAALDAARASAMQAGATACLTIFGDLPLLRAEDVVALADALGPDSSAVVAPDRRRQGTNALVLRPADALPYAFGPRSFVQHLESARAAGVPVRVHTYVGTSFDLDTPADLDEMHRRRAAPAWLWTTAPVGCEHSTCRAELEVVAQEQGG